MLDVDELVLSAADDRAKVEAAVRELEAHRAVRHAFSIKGQRPGIQVQLFGIWQALPIGASRCRRSRVASGRRLAAAALRVRSMVAARLRLAAIEIERVHVRNCDDHSWA